MDSHARRRHRISGVGGNANTIIVRRFVRLLQHPRLSLHFPILYIHTGPEKVTSKTQSPLPAASLRSALLPGPLSIRPRDTSWTHWSIRRRNGGVAHRRLQEIVRVQGRVQQAAIAGIKGPKSHRRKRPLRARPGAAGAPQRPAAVQMDPEREIERRTDLRGRRRDVACDVAVGDGVVSAIPHCGCVRRPRARGPALDGEGPPDGRQQRAIAANRRALQRRSGGRRVCREGLWLANPIRLKSRQRAAFLRHAPMPITGVIGMALSTPMSVASVGDFCDYCAPLAVSVLVLPRLWTGCQRRSKLAQLWWPRLARRSHGSGRDFCAVQR